MKDQANSRECPICRGDMHPGLASWHFECRRCNYEASNLVPKINEETSHQHLDETSREGGLRWIREQNFKTILQALENAGLCEHVNLLDVGCAHGWFLDLARNKYRAEGIEPDARICGSNFNNKVRCGYFPDVIGASERFDLITFNDVLEHIPDVRYILDNCVRFLSPGGILVLNLPNKSGFLYRISKMLSRLGFSSHFERLWQLGFPSPHVHYFSRESLSKLGEDFGFRVWKFKELRSISSVGLRERINYDKTGRKTGGAFTYWLLRMAIPILNMLPSDNMVLFLRKSKK